MMRLFVTLCLAGVVVYALIPPRGEPDWNAPSEIDSAPESAIAQIEAKPPIDRKLRSWGPTLQALGRGPEPVPSKQFGASLPPRQEAAYGPGRTEDQEVKAPAAIDVAAEPIAWAKIVFAARSHRDASVSSPVIKLYPAGAELQVVGRKSAWLQVLDPVTFERGWVFENYLVSIDGPTPTRSAIQSAPEPRPVKAAASKSQTPRQSSKQAAPAPDAIEVAGADRRQERSARTERRGLFGLFFKGRDARPAAWSVGSPGERRRAPDG